MARPTRDTGEIAMLQVMDRHKIHGVLATEILPGIFRMNYESGWPKDEKETRLSKSTYDSWLRNKRMNAKYKRGVRAFFERCIGQHTTAENLACHIDPADTSPQGLRVTVPNYIFDLIEIVYLNKKFFYVIGNTDTHIILSDVEGGEPITIPSVQFKIVK